MTKPDEFELDLQYSEGSYELPFGTLNRDVAERMVQLCGELLAEKRGYRDARETALDETLSLLEVTEKERKAYQDFINRRSGRWLARDRKRRKAMKEVPFAPLEAYEGDLL